MNEPSLSIDGFGPLPVKRPTSVSELGDIIRGEPSAIYPVGGQTQIGLGKAPVKPGVAVDLRGLDRVVDFPARDMTITVEAGITLAKLEEIITAENLRLPIDVPQAAIATLGGTLAANVSGPRRFGFGTLRDYVIGISALNDEGNEFKSGGRVVKNVAGYDICKLLVGSLGTLGIISQVTLKLRPRAEEQALVCVPCATEKIAGLLDLAMSSRTRPVILDVLNRAGANALLPAGTCTTAASVLVIGYEGNTDAVKWQMQHLVKEIGVNFPMEARVGFTGKPLDAALTEWPAWQQARMTLKASLPSSGVTDFFRHVESLGGEPHLQAHAGNGIVIGHYAGDHSQNAARNLLAGWRQKASAVVVAKCPPEWKSALDVWGPAPPGIDVMREVKARFDSRGKFNPGRFLVG